MNNKEIKNKKIRAIVLLCWLVYTSAYLGRYSYSSNINYILSFYNVNHGQAGLVTTFFFFAYGLGQILNGIVCKYYNKKYIIPFALIVSTLVNILIFADIGFKYIKYLWLINGIVQSILWPTLISVISENLKTEDLKKAILIMSTTVPLGTFLIYGSSALFSVSNNFKLSFLLGAIAMLVVAVVWLINYERLTTDREFVEGADEKENLSSKKEPSRLLYIILATLALFAIINNIVKDGLTTWVPSILKESFDLGDGLSILLTLTLPILGLFGTALATKLSGKIKSFISLSGVLYLFSATFLIITIYCLKISNWMIALVAFGFISMFMHGVNNVITSMVPLYLRKQVNAGMLAGVLNGFCYVGSTISSYGLGAVADKFNWLAVFYLLLILSAIPVIVSCFAKIFNKTKKNHLRW